MKLTLGEKLKDLRIERKLTSKQVCDEIKKQYGYSLSVGKYNEMESDIDKDFGYRAFIYLSKFYEVSTDYLLGITETPSLDKNIQNACNVTGLSEEAIKKVSELDNNCKSALNYFISFEGVEDFFTMLSQIIITAEDKRAFNFIYGDFWDKFQNEPSWDYLDKECACFISCYYSTHIYAPYHDFDDILYDEQIDLDHFKLNKVISKIISQITTEILDRKRREAIINELEIYFQSDYDKFCDNIYIEEDAMLSEHDLKQFKKIDEIQINKFRKAKKLIDFLKSTLKD